MKNKLKILIADDHVMIAESLRNIINQEDDMFVVDIALDGKDALDKVKSNEIDLLVLDIGMPEMNGIEVMQQLKIQNIHIKVLILSSHDDGEFIKELMRLGAGGYLLKTHTSEYLIESIRRVARGEKALNLELTSKLIDYMSNPDAIHNNPVIRITEREKEVLNLIAKGLTSSQISKELYISENTVITHKKKLFSKFEVSNAPSLVKKAVEMGKFA